MKVYVAGPMTGLPQFNFPAFDAAAVDLRARGYDVVSPAELDDEEDRAAALKSEDGSALSYGNGVKKTWGEFLARDVKLISDGGIDAIFVLPGWRKSRGARLETFVGAAMNGKPIYCYMCTTPSMDADIQAAVKAIGRSRVPAYALETAWAGREHDSPMGSHG